MKQRIGIGLAAVLAAAACGGGGGGGGSSVGVVSGPSVTPSSAPSSPAPIPSPSFAIYPTYAQLTGDQTFRTACAALNFSAGNPPGPQPATGYGDGLTFGYTAASDSYAIGGDGLALSFAPGDRDPAAPAGARSYLRTEANGFQTRFSIGQPAPGGTPLDYVRGASLRTQKFGQTFQYLCIFGVPTLLSDPPAASVVTFTRTGVAGTAYLAPASGALQTYALTNSVATLSVNVATGTLTTTIRLVGNLVNASGTAATTTELGTYAATTSFDNTRQSYGGAFTSGDRQSQFSTFGGWFFGPQGQEAAYAAEILAADPATGARVSALINVTAAR